MYGTGAQQAGLPIGRQAGLRKGGVVTVGRSGYMLGPRRRFAAARSLALPALRAGKAANLKPKNLKPKT